jgi:hypothetical protein
VNVLSLHANTVSDYFENIRQTGRADFSAGMRIVQSHNTPELLNALNEYYSDTLVFVRRQAYFLTYRKGLEERENAQVIVARLAQGLSERDGALRGTIIGYLQAFPLSAFNEESKRLIANEINRPNSPHYDELVLLAGFVGVGNNDLLRLSMNSDLPTRTRWNISLALARLGNENALQAAVERVRRAPVNSGMVLNLLPDLVYTRQKLALDYCVELLFIDEKLCRTANPDLSESILCAYPIIELIAPVIVDFPIVVDPSIGIETDNYEELLRTVRKWFEENRNFKIYDFRF